MKPTRLFSRFTLAAVLLLLGTLPAFASPSNKWRIQCSEGAKSTGQLGLVRAFFPVECGGLPEFEWIFAIEQP